MAEECAESCSVVTSSSSVVVPPSNWWDLHGAGGSSALSPWCNNSGNNNISSNNNIPWHHQAYHVVPNPNSNSDEDVSISTSFTNASNHSGLTVESSHRLVEPAASSSADDLIGPDQQAQAAAASDSQIWSHVFLNVGSNGDLQSHQDVGENFLDMLSSSKSMYELPACDYLKKLDNSGSNHWDQLSNSSSPNNMITTNNNFFNHQKPINGFNVHHHDNHHHDANMGNSMSETERLTKLSNLISTWSIAPPDREPELSHGRHFVSPQISLSSSLLDHHHHYPNPNNLCHNSGLFPPCYVHNLKVESEQGGAAGDTEAHGAPHSAVAGALLRRSFNGFNGSNIIRSSNMVEDNEKYHNSYAMNSMDSYSNSCGDSAKNFADVISFSGRLGKPLIDIHGADNNSNSKNNNINNKPSSVKSLGLSDSKKQGLHTSSSPPTRSGGRGQGNTSGTEGKKKRSEDSNSEISLKKPKQESSTASSTKMQAPKIKLGDRITALQQIVSPFGKTDTASVLYEAIQYIKFLQEQVQLLSNPYLKTNSHKDLWGSLDRKMDHLKADRHVKVDLRSRGLCLVPVSCTPQVYRENTGSDYWTPTYRGCLYR